ncbi:hypothetical protein [Ligilactobacillus salivarius]|uniref:hypothetical protein n=1 Tax=Ligilactobacillus salivarius TaxID=1624 RepID=UPI001956239D|nr:hypothetical protein [Ligilactobacillus salivarius]MBM6786944.1 hypothetical protein [Ligilactobacillus salivarius]
MNENFINMYTELNRKYSDDYGRDLRIDAIDRKDRYDNDEFFDETLLDVVRIYYKQQTISIERYYENNWEIEDYDYLKFEDFREIGKILSIVMKHISRIELD